MRGRANTIHRAIKQLKKQANIEQLVGELEDLRRLIAKKRPKHTNLIELAQYFYNLGDVQAATRIWALALKAQLNHHAPCEARYIIKSFLHERMKSIEGEAHSRAEYDFREDHISWCMEEVDKNIAPSSMPQDEHITLYIRRIVIPFS